MKKTPPLTLYKRIASVFIGVTVVLLLVVFYYSLTYAFITIKPKITQKDYPVSIVVSQEAQSDDFMKGVFVGNLISSDFEKTITVPATGKKNITSSGTGKVVIVNNNTKPQPLIATTRLLTSANTLLRIQDGVTVPAAGRVEVLAKQDDSQGVSAIAVGDKLTIPGLSQDLQALTFAEIVSDFAGEQREAVVVTKEDIDSGISKMMNEIETTLKESYADGKRLVIQPEIIEQINSAGLGEEATEVTIKAKIKIKAVIFDDASVNSHIMKMAESALGVDEELYLPENLQTHFTIDTFDTEHKVSQLKGVVQVGTIIRQNAPSLDPKKLVRLGVDEVKGYLENFEEIESAQVSFFPFWVRKVPAFEDHVIINIDLEGLTKEK